MITSLSPREVILNVARGHDWVKEHGINAGEAVEAILARAGLHPGQPWCAAFVAYVGWLVFREGWSLARVGGCVSLWEDAKQKGLLRTGPAMGAVFLLWREDAKPAPRFGHTGFLWDQLPNGHWRTIEGNTSPGGSPEGTGVFVRERSFAPEDAFIWWWDFPAA